MPGSTKTNPGGDFFMYGTWFRGLGIVALAAALSPATAAEFTIVNASDVILRHVYVSPCGATQWGPDQLAIALPPSRDFTIDVAAGCYDIEFVTDPWNVCVVAGTVLRGRKVWKVTQWTVFGSQSGDCSHVARYAPAGRRRWTW